MVRELNECRDVEIIEGQDLEIGAVDKLLVGELGEDRVQHGDGHQD